MNWFQRFKNYLNTPVAPTLKRKTVLIMGADGKKHRADAETHVIVGKTAMKRHLRGLKKHAQDQAEDREAAGL